MAQTETILKDLKQAILVKQSLKVSTLRMVVAALKNKRIEKGEDLDELEELQVLKREAKKRREAIEVYQKAGRQELADKEGRELKILEIYLPKQMTKEAIVKIVEQMKKVNEFPNDFSKAMKAVMGKVKGQAEGKLVLEVVKSQL